MHKIRIAIVGVGKIARDQHLSAVTANSAYQLVATADPHAALHGIPAFQCVEALLEGVPDLDAVVVCTPPQARYAIARYALAQGRHVMLEKPPCTSVSQARELIELARARGLALFAAWHSREAAGVEPARQWLAGRRVASVAINWREDARVWHPGQTWIWQAGGMGVFDAGVNALSIATQILPGRLVLRDAELLFPAGCDAPVAALLRFDMHEAHVTMNLDFRPTSSHCWTIDVQTDAGVLQLSEGGAVMRINSESLVAATDQEYPRLYDRFKRLVSERRIDVDLTPLQLVADAYVSGRRTALEPIPELRQTDV